MSINRRVEEITTMARGDSLYKELYRASMAGMKNLPLDYMEKEDIFHTVLERIIYNWEKHKDKTKEHLKGMVGKASRNKALDRLNYTNRHVNYEDDLPSQVSSYYEPNHWLHDEALRQSTDTTTYNIAQNILAGYTYGEIAEKTGLTYEQVRYRTKQIKQAIIA